MSVRGLGQRRRCQDDGACPCRCDHDHTCDCGGPLSATIDLDQE